MDAFLIGIGVFVLLGVAALGTMALHPRLPARYRDDDTNAVVRVVANIFVVITSLSFGLLINSAKTTFDTIEHNVHSHAANLILMDRMLRSYGPEAQAARDRLVDYVHEAIARPARADDVLDMEGDSAGRRLDDIHQALAAINPGDAYRVQLIDGLLDQYQKIAELRWIIVEQSDGSLPAPIVAVLVAWLTLIFISFGYRAPRNGVVIGTFLTAAFLIAASIYLVLDMDLAFSGPIQVSDAPLHRALAEITR